MKKLRRIRVKREEEKKSFWKKPILLYSLAAAIATIIIIASVVIYFSKNRQVSLSPYSYYFYSGYNYFSLVLNFTAVNPEALRVDNFLNAINSGGGDCDKIYAWGWLYGYWELMNSSDFLDYGKSYAINCLSDSTLTISGELLPPKNLELFSGPLAGIWNSFGTRVGMENMKIGQLIGGCKPIGSSPGKPISSLDSATRTWVGKKLDDNIEVGTVYQVYCMERGVWDFDSSYLNSLIKEKQVNSFFNEIIGQGMYFQLNKTNFEMNITAERKLNELSWLLNNKSYSLLDNSLLLMYNFDNENSLGESSAKVSDISQYGNNGEVINATWVSSGKYEGYYTFTARNGEGIVINATNSDLFNINNTSQASMTISAWIMPLATPSEKNIIAKAQGSIGGKSGWMFYVSGSTLGFTYNNGSADAQFVSGGNIPTNDFTHTVVVINSTSIALYANGILKANKIINRTGSWANSNAVAIGKRGTSTGIFNGSIDEVRIWNRSLSADEINFLYRSNLKKKDENNWVFKVLNQPLIEGLNKYKFTSKDNYGDISNTEERSFYSYTDSEHGPKIEYDYPTPENSADYIGLDLENSIKVNATISNLPANSLEGLYFPSSIASEFSIFDDWLVGMYNFDNIKSIGESLNSAQYLINGSIYNGDFEIAGSLGSNDKFADWMEFADGKSTINDQELDFGHNDVYSGNHALRFDVRGYGPLGDNAKISQLILTPGKKYRLSFWAKVNDASNSPKIWVGMFLGNGYINRTLTTTWTQYTIDFTAETVLLEISRGINSNGKSIYIDDVQLQEIDNKIVDLSSQKNNGVNYGATWTQNGKYRGAYSFDGVNDYVEINHSSSLDFGANNFTISFWIYPLSITGDKVILEKASSYSVGGGTQGLDIEIENGKLRVDVRNGTARNGITTGANTVSSNEWQHFVVARDMNGNDNVKIYKNGVNMALTNLSNIYNWNISNSVNLRLGYDAAAGRLFNGKIDEVRIFAKALSADEVKQLYNSNLRKEEAGGKWNFYANLTGLTRGINYYGLRLVDMYSNSVSTLRNLTIELYSSQMKFEPATPASNSKITDADANVSIIATILNTSTIKQLDLKWKNGINFNAYPIYDNSLVAMYNFENLPSLSETKNYTIVRSVPVLNWDFENSGAGGNDIFADWIETAPPGSSIVKDTTEHFFGASSAKLIIDAGNPDVYLKQENILTPGKTYRIIARMKSNVSGKTIAIGHHSNIKIVSLTTDWAVYSINFMASSGTLFLDPSSAANSSIWIDGVELQEIDSNVADLSLYGNNGKILDATWTPNGKYGGAFEFDGINDGIVINDPVLNSTEMTICAWAYKKGYNPYQSIAYDYTSKKKNWILGYETGPNTIRFYAGNGTTVELVAIPGFTPNAWHFVCGGFKNKTEIWIYLDGNKVNSTTNISNIGATQNFNSGIGYYGGNYIFNGTIDEVRIWNRSLSLDEVSQMYASNLRKIDDGTWKLTWIEPKMMQGVNYYNMTSFDKHNRTLSLDLSLDSNRTLPITTCTTITSSGVYKLRNNLTGGGGMCMIINSDNVVLDGGGYEIKGNFNTTYKNFTYNFGEAGIYIKNSTNTTIKNVRVNNFGDTAIYSQDSDILMENVVSLNSYWGIMAWKYKIQLLNVAALNITMDGIMLDTITESNFNSVKANNNGYAGIYIANSDNNTFNSIEANSNGFKDAGAYGGIVLDNSDNNSFNSISLSNNNRYGIYLYDYSINSPVFGRIWHNRFSNITFLNNTINGADGIVDDTTIPIYDVPSNGLTLNYAGKTYVLQNDLINLGIDYPNYCFSFRANNIILDGNGKNIINGANTPGRAKANGIYASQMDNIIIKNFAQISDFNYGYLANNCFNNTIINSRFSLNDNGIKLVTRDRQTESGHHNLIGVTSINNSIGLSIEGENNNYKGNYNLIVNSSFSYNYGIYGYGIKLIGSHNIFDNVILLGNNESGIEIGGSSLIYNSNNTLSNSMIFGNLYGVKMNVNYNDKNKFYNNFFNNTYNVNISANGGQNIGNHIFNASRTDGRNIIGQNVIGGNYWAKPDRSGYSQTCNDADNNKICDEKYNLTLSSTINIDYLPLTGEIRLGPYCGDTTCNNGETCSSCSIDCGTCSVTPGGGTGGGGSGGGSGGGGSGTKTCTPNWNCYWGICKNNIEKRICNDKNLCGTNKNKPKEDGNTRACSANAECIDNDGDGYGIGAGCLGEDLDDANSAITNKIIQEKTFMEKAKAFFYKYENYIIYSLLALAVIFILAVILTAIRKHKRKKLFAEMRKKKEERINQAIQLVDKWRKDGYNDLIIREMFKEKGWKDEDIEMIMM